MSGCAEFDALVKALQSAGVVGRIEYKEKLVSREVLQGGCRQKPGTGTRLLQIQHKLHVTCERSC